MKAFAVHPAADMARVDGCAQQALRALGVHACALNARFVRGRAERARSAVAPYINSLPARYLMSALTNAGALLRPKPAALTACPRMSISVAAQTPPRLRSPRAASLLLPK